MSVLILSSQPSSDGSAETLSSANGYLLVKQMRRLTTRAVTDDALANNYAPEG
jgi:hypothetical protein